MRRFLILAMALALSACASSSGKRDPGTSRNQISESEVDQAVAQGHQSNALEVIQILRPHFLRGGARTMSGAQGPIVYQNGMRLGETDTLRSIPVTMIQTIEFLDAASATISYGINHTGGAILIRTKGSGG